MQLCEAFTRRALRAPGLLMKLLAFVWIVESLGEAAAGWAMSEASLDDWLMTSTLRLSRESDRRRRAERDVSRTLLYQETIATTVRDRSTAGFLRTVADIML